MPRRAGPVGHAGLARARPPEGLLEAAGQVAYSRVYQLGGEDLKVQLDKMQQSEKANKERSVHTSPRLHGEPPARIRPSLDNVRGYEEEWETALPLGPALEQLQDCHSRHWMQSEGPETVTVDATGAPLPPSASWGASCKRVATMAASVPTSAPARTALPNPGSAPRSARAASRPGSASSRRSGRSGTGGRPSQAGDDDDDASKFGAAGASCRLWLNDETASAAAAAAVAAGSGDDDERDVAAHLYSVRLSKAVMGMISIELTAAGAALHPHAADRLEASIGAEVQSQLDRLLQAWRAANPAAAALPSASAADTETAGGEGIGIGGGGGEDDDDDDDAEVLVSLSVRSSGGGGGGGGGSGGGGGGDASRLAERRNARAPAELQVPAASPGDVAACGGQRQRPPNTSAALRRSSGLCYAAAVAAMQPAQPTPPPAAPAELKPTPPSSRPRTAARRADAASEADGVPGSEVMLLDAPAAPLADGRSERLAGLTDALAQEAAAVLHGGLNGAVMLLGGHTLRVPISELIFGEAARDGGEPTTAEEMLYAAARQSEEAADRARQQASAAAALGALTVAAQAADAEAHALTAEAEVAEAIRLGAERAAAAAGATSPEEALRTAAAGLADARAAVPPPPPTQAVARGSCSGGSGGGSGGGGGGGGGGSRGGGGGSIGVYLAPHPSLREQVLEPLLATAKAARGVHALTLWLPPASMALLSATDAADAAVSAAATAAEAAAAADSAAFAELGNARVYAKDRARAAGRALAAAADAAAELVTSGSAGAHGKFQFLEAAATWRRDGGATKVEAPLDRVPPEVYAEARRAGPRDTLVTVRHVVKADPAEQQQQRARRRVGEPAQPLPGKVLLFLVHTRLPRVAAVTAVQCDPSLLEEQGYADSSRELLKLQLVSSATLAALAGARAGVRLGALLN